MVSAIKSWDEFCTAIEQVPSLPTRTEQIEAMRQLRQRACDLQPGPDGESVKRMTIDVIDWAIGLASEGQLSDEGVGSAMVRL